MKTKTFTMVLCILLLGCFSALADTEAVDIDIREKMFIAQVEDVMINSQDYMGKTIRMQGIFRSFFWDFTGKTYLSVIRYSPGCCGDDGVVGFDVRYDGDLPETDDWVEVVGMLEAYEENGTPYLRLALSSITVLEDRGAEFVTQ